MTTSITAQLQRLKKIRVFVLQTVKELSAEQLNKVPEGYNNNVIWNMAHLVAAQEGVCYLRSGQPTHVSETYFSNYKPGSKPAGDLTAAEIADIKALLISSYEQLEADIQENKFVSYQPWTTRYEVAMNDIEGAVDFLLFHEGMHLGYIMALKRLL